MSLIFSVGFVLFLICILSTLIDFRYSFKISALGLVSGTLGIVLFIVWVDYLHLFTITKIFLLVFGVIPTYFLIHWLSKLRDIRFTYTFTLGLSITIFISTLITYLNTYTKNILTTVFITFLFTILINGSLFLFFRSNFLEAMTHKTKNWKRIVTIPLLSLVMIFIMTDKNLVPGIESDYFSVTLVIYLILLLSHFYAHLYIQSFYKETLLENNNLILEKLIDSMKSNLNDQIESIKSTKLYRHDLRHHLGVLSTFAHENKTEEFDAYVESLNHKLNETALSTYCENININAVLSVYLKNAEEASIVATHEISLSEKLPIDEIDVGLIIANGIENAINANLKMPRLSRNMLIKIKNDQKILTILIQNPLCEDISFKDGLPQANQAGHGLGTLGIQRLAEKAKGSALFSVEKGRFTLIVQLPLTV